MVSLAYLCTSVRKIDLNQKVIVAADSIFRSLLFFNMKPENHFVRLKLLSSHWFVVGIQTKIKYFLLHPHPCCAIIISSIISLYLQQV